MDLEHHTSLDASLTGSPVSEGLTPAGGDGLSHGPGVRLRLSYCGNPELRDASDSDHDNDASFGASGYDAPGGDTNRGPADYQDQRVVSASSLFVAFPPSAAAVTPSVGMKSKSSASDHETPTSGGTHGPTISFVPSPAGDGSGGSAAPASLVSNPHAITPRAGSGVSPSNAANVTAAAAAFRPLSVWAQTDLRGLHGTSVTVEDVDRDGVVATVKRVARGAESVARQLGLTDANARARYGPPLPTVMLRVVELPGCGLGDEGLAALLDALAVDRRGFAYLERLDLSFNSLTDAGAESVAALVRLIDAELLAEKQRRIAAETARVMKKHAGPASPFGKRGGGGGAGSPRAGGAGRKGSDDASSGARTSPKHSSVGNATRLVLGHAAERARAKAAAKHAASAPSVVETEDESTAGTSHQQHNPFDGGAAVSAGSPGPFAGGGVSTASISVADDLSDLASAAFGADRGGGAMLAQSVSIAVSGGSPVQVEATPSALVHRRRTMGHSVVLAASMRMQASAAAVAAAGTEESAMSPNSVGAAMMGTNDAFGFDLADLAHPHHSQHPDVPAPLHGSSAVGGLSSSSPATSEGAAAGGRKLWQKAKDVFRHASARRATTVEGTSRPETQQRVPSPPSPTSRKKKPAVSLYAGTTPTADEPYFSNLILPCLRHIALCDNDVTDVGALDIAIALSDCSAVKLDVALDGNDTRQLDPVEDAVLASTQSRLQKAASTVKNALSISMAKSARPA